MKLTKQIIDGFVSWIDLKDVQEYIQQLEKIQNLDFMTDRKVVLNER